MANDKPVTRKERFLAGAAGEDITLDTPITREERFLAKAAGMDVKTDDPVTRSEKYLAKIAEGGGGGGGDIPSYTGSYTVTPSEQTQTLATDGKKCTDDITVNPIPSSYVQPTGTKQITQNGTGIDVAAYADVDVAVPTGITPTGTIQITENGQVDVTQYATADVNVSGGTVVEAPMKDVNFYDYDGTRLYSYTASEFLALSAMPENPTHDGLTAQGWNWSLADAKEQVQVMGAADIGQMYVTDDGKTRIYIHLERNWLNPTIKIAINGSATIDWGDNSTQTTISGGSITTNNAISASHSYATEGDYMISISVDGEVGLGTYNSSYSWVLTDGSNSNADNVYIASIIKVEIGNNIVFRGKAFANCRLLESVTIPKSIHRFWGNDFDGCKRLSAIVIPEEMSATNSTSLSVCNKCLNLSVVSIPKSVTNIASSAFAYCYELRRLVIPYTLLSVDNSAFSYTDIGEISVPSGMTTFSSNLLASEAVFEARFASAIPPTSGSSSAMAYLYKGSILLVPFSGLASYVAPPTNYPSTTDHIYIGYATHANGVVLPTQDATQAYNVTWYPTREDEFNETNPITVGNGNEIYCRYTAV